MGRDDLSSPAAPRLAAAARFMRSLLLVATLLPALAQDPRATIRVEVKSEAAPIPGALVTLNGITVQTGQNGVASTTLPPGLVEGVVSKEGFFPAKISFTANEPREWPVTV